MTDSASVSAAPLPVVVQIGFSGSRRLLPDDLTFTTDQRATFLQRIEDYLFERLELLRQELGLSPQHFFCGISQIAIGADTAFTKACCRREIPQRIFLPQHREEYLNAIGSKGPDFTPAEVEIARALLDSPHIIQERVVSDAPDRPNRFHDSQLELLRVSNVVVCMLADGASTNHIGCDQLAPGTAGLVDLARKNGHPVLTIRVRARDHLPEFSEEWHHLDNFMLPSLPNELAAIELPPGPHLLPDVHSYTAALKNSGSQLADSSQSLFKNAAFLIIGAHLTATIAAVLAMVFKPQLDLKLWVQGLLIFELIVLAASFYVHEYLHKSHACRVWAVSRVVAEIARSVQAITDHHVYLSHLFQLPFPKNLRPLLRTLNVLHLCSSSANLGSDWRPRRDAYLEKRLIAKNGQLEYHRKVHRKSGQQLRLARAVFLACSIAAILSTLLKLSPWGPEKLLGSLAIILPVLAVGGLSLAAAFDLEARHNTSEEMLTDLKDLEVALRSATSEREFTRLLLETESRLLGETANWFSRRSFTGVA